MFWGNNFFIIIIIFTFHLQLENIANRMNEQTKTDALYRSNVECDCVCVCVCVCVVQYTVYTSLG